MARYQLANKTIIMIIVRWFVCASGNGIIDIFFYLLRSTLLHILIFIFRHHSRGVYKQIQMRHNVFFTCYSRHIFILIFIHFYWCLPVRRQNRCTDSACWTKARCAYSGRCRRSPTNPLLIARCNRDVISGIVNSEKSLIRIMQNVNKQICFFICWILHGIMSARSTKKCSPAMPAMKKRHTASKPSTTTKRNARILFRINWQLLFNGGWLSVALSLCCRRLALAKDTNLLYNEENKTTSYTLYTTYAQHRHNIAACHMLSVYSSDYCPYFIRRQWYFYQLLAITIACSAWANGKERRHTHGIEESFTVFVAVSSIALSFCRPVFTIFLYFIAWCFAENMSTLINANNLARRTSYKGLPEINQSHG